MSKQKMRIIADPKDADALQGADSIEHDLSPFFEMNTVSVCPPEEHSRCMVKRNCSIVIALFTEQPAELTASMISVCAGCLPTCTGVVIILEPHDHQRTLVLPPLKNIIRKNYRRGDPLSLLILEALVDHARSYQGGILNLPMPDEYTRVYTHLQQNASVFV